jgi:prevent-host-death family protein
MSAIVGTFEAKTHLSELLDQVQRGESVTITRHGTPIARLVPAVAKLTPQQLTAQLRRVRALAPADAPTITPEEIREWIAEGRR